MQQLIAVVMGGHGTDAEVARRAGEGVALALESRGHEVLRVPVDAGLEDALRAAAPDAAFLVLEGSLASEGTVQARIERLGLPHTGPSAQAARTAGHHRARRASLQLHNLPLSQGYAIQGSRADDAITVHGDLGFPCSVRPVRAVPGRDAMEVASSEALSAAIRWATQSEDEAHVERSVAGLRITVALLGGEVLGLQLSAADAAASRRSKARRLTAERRANLEALALGAARALDCNGPLLVEFSVPAEDNEVITSIDAAPRLVPRGLFSTIAGQSLASYAQLIDRVLAIVEVAPLRITAPRGVIRESFQLAWAS